MFTGPDATPVTMPVPVPTDAMALLLDDHVVVPAGSVSVIVCPAQTVDGPEMADGSALMVINAVAEQPVPNVNEITSVPAVTPDTVPVPLTVAFPLLAVHAPTPASVREMVDPIQTCEGPEMAPAAVFTDTVLVTKQLPSV